MKTSLFLIILVLTSLSMTSCTSSNSKEKDAETTNKDTASEKKDKDGKEAEITEIPVNIAPAERGEISAFLEFDSILETESAVEIYAESNGLITKILAEVGDPVEAGQLLAQLENEEQEVNLRESLSRYKHLQSKFKRTEDLFERNLINQQEYDTEIFDLEQAEINYERSRIRLEDTLIRAPVSGIISKRLTQLGERVTASKKLYTIMNPDELFAQVNIPAQHMLSIQKGLPSEIVSEIIEGISYQASVKLVSPTIDPSSGTFNVKVVVDNNGSMPIYPGMFVNVLLILDTKKDVVLIPKSAIVHEGERTYVYKVEENLAHKIPFHPGYANTDSVESTSGIEEGEQIIVLGHNALKDGAKVKIVSEAYSAEKTQETVADEPAEG